MLFRGSIKRCPCAQRHRASAHLKAIYGLLTDPVFEIRKDSKSPLRDPGPRQALRDTPHQLALKENSSSLSPLSSLVSSFAWQRNPPTALPDNAISKSVREPHPQQASNPSSRPGPPRMPKLFPARRNWFLGSRLCSSVCAQALFELLGILM